MDKSFSFTFPYGFPNPFSLENFLEEIEQLNGFEFMTNIGEIDYIVIDEGNDYYFALRYYEEMPKQTISLFCYTIVKLDTEFGLKIHKKLLTTFELRDYQHDSPDECYMVLTGEEEANQKFLGYLIQAFPSTDGIKEPK